MCSLSHSLGKLILAGEHSVVHFTRALASVIAQRTFAEFTFTPAAADEKDDHALTIELRIETEQINEVYTWSYAQLQSHAAASFPSLPMTLDALTPILDSKLKPSLLALPHVPLPTDATKLVSTCES
jgi:mevalonate kinase